MARAETFENGTNLKSRQLAGMSTVSAKADLMRTWWDYRSWQDSDLRQRTGHDRSTPDSGPSSIYVRYCAAIGPLSLGMQT